MARERRRAEFAAGARVQRIGEDGDLRTVGEEAVRGSGLESGGGRDSRFSFGAMGVRVSLPSRMPQALGVWVSPHGYACRHRVSSRFGWVRC